MCNFIRETLLLLVLVSVLVPHARANVFNDLYLTRLRISDKILGAKTSYQYFINPGVSEYYLIYTAIQAEDTTTQTQYNIYQFMRADATDGTKKFIRIREPPAQPIGNFKAGYIDAIGSFKTK